MRASSTARIVREWGCEAVWQKKCPHHDHPAGPQYNGRVIREDCATVCDAQQRGEAGLVKPREEKRKEKLAEIAGMAQCLDSRAKAEEKKGDKNKVKDLGEVMVAEAQMLLGDEESEEPEDPEQVAAVQKAEGSVQGLFCASVSCCGCLWL